MRQLPLKVVLYVDDGQPCLPFAGEMGQSRSLRCVHQGQERVGVCSGAGLHQLINGRLMLQVAGLSLSVCVPPRCTSSTIVSIWSPIVGT